MGAGPHVLAHLVILTCLMFPDLPKKYLGSVTLIENWTKTDLSISRVQIGRVYKNSFSIWGDQLSVVRKKNRQKYNLRIISWV